MTTTRAPLFAVTLAAATLTTILTACGGGKPAEPPPAPAKAQYGSFGIDLTAPHTAVKPGDDFFTFANGTWFDKFQIPADKSSYGAFNRLDDDARANVRKIIEEAAASKPATGSVEQKIGDYYASFMDTAKIEKDGLGAIKPDLDRIAAVKDSAELARLFGEPGYQSPVGAYVNSDAKDPNSYTFEVAQDGLGLPNRDYY